MPTTHCVNVDTVPPQPWQNGGGTTRVLLAWPDGAGWQVRISVADIAADGPFSAFPGVSRWFAVLSGAGVGLTVDGMLHTLRTGDAALSFSGGAATTCRLLDGGTRDLNLMLRGADGGMHPAHHAASWRPGASACGLFATFAGVCQHGSVRTTLDAGSLLWLDPAPASLRFDALEPRTPGATIGWWLAATPMQDGAA